ncbi:NHLP leader peptide family RiPP precursor [Nostoc sp. 106C]|uniref:NHLP leader peptide family RiPP precursor n=1 Tax=Nostoc sp. 106C TaxID=1932667 RepID=UPI000A37DD26|nr:NHLP leader peptide family RiPP precursor [Nostoc sp. 106C]OUL32376.1 hypothetical protein BV375_10030 [Nostoc sp. 106C]
MNNQDKTPEGITPLLPLWSYQLQQDSKLTVKTRKDLEIHLITRALKDEGFRQELMANPKAVVEQELGSKLPEELEINVLEETEDTLYMVLPCNPYEGISEEDLKASLGMTYEDVVQWVLEQHRNSLLDEESSVKLMTRAWRNGAFKQELFKNPKWVIEKEFNKNLPEVIEIKVVEENYYNLYVIFPNIIDNLDTNEDFFDLLNLNVQIVMGGSGDLAGGCKIYAPGTCYFGTCETGILTIGGCTFPRCGDEGGSRPV